MTNSVVSIYTQRSHDIVVMGTGFFISPTHILTCEHVVRRKGPYWILINDQLIKLLPILKNKKLDYALLTLSHDKSEEGPPLPLLPSTPPLNSEVITICPHERRSPFKGQLFFTCSMVEDYLEEISYIIKGAKLKPGTSGSPVLFDGKVIGIHYCIGLGKYNANKSGCVPIKYVLEDIVKKGKAWNGLAENV